MPKSDLEWDESPQPEDEGIVVPIEPERPQPPRRQRKRTGSKKARGRARPARSTPRE